MSAWFEGDDEIACSLDSVTQAIDNIGQYFTAVVRLMPGLTSVALVEQRPDEVIITTNEGLMKRTNLSKRVENDRITIEFDEEYQAGSRVTVNSHATHQFTTTDNGVTQHLRYSRCHRTRPHGLLLAYVRKREDREGTDDSREDPSRGFVQLRPSIIRPIPHRSSICSTLAGTTSTEGASGPWIAELPWVRVR